MLNLRVLYSALVTKLLKASYQNLRSSYWIQSQPASLSCWSTLEHSSHSKKVKQQTFFVNRFYVIKAILHVKYIIVFQKPNQTTRQKGTEEISLYQSVMGNMLTAAFEELVSLHLVLKLHSSQSATNCCSALIYNISTGGDRIVNNRCFLLTSSRLCLSLLMCI